ncbi:Host cell surface-exposed lipoprotein [compost metagenome]
MNMSKKGIYDQLTSEYGENFPKEAAQYAIDNIKFDWKESALKKAQLYAETMSMSDSAIYEQLTSEYGEKFTAEEAQYAIDNLE